MLLFKQVNFSTWLIYADCYVQPLVYVTIIEKAELIHGPAQIAQVHLPIYN